MSDADRLRQAAEVMDSATSYEPPDDGDLDTPAAEWVIHCHACAVNERTAALLRAVADYQYDQHTDCCGYCAEVTCDPECPWPAALALADVILGGAA